MPVLPGFITAPLWEQFQALLPERTVTQPLCCHRPRIPDRVVFDRLLARLVLGGTYQQHADQTCSATTMRARRDEWIRAGVFEHLHRFALEAYDQAVGLDLPDLVVDGCIVKAPCGGQNTGRSPVDRGKSGLKRSVLVDGSGIPIGWVLAGANRNDSPLPRPTLETLAVVGLRLPDAITVHLDAGYDSRQIRELLAELGCIPNITPRGTFLPINHTHRWVIERTNSWHNRGFAALAKVTDRREEVQNAWVALASAIIIIRRLIRRSWPLYRWEGRPARRP
ncbi:IS5 family transposase [Streptomyces violaceus]|uniref:IS5 family transposase n=1 Tax=Streptomyces violaceus TaxID=1936 RepID=A0ABZ1NZB4_STRVL|nr:IS5 family transposase [Streptomyces violaceus]